MKAKAMNKITIGVKCNGDAVSITVDPFEAHARAGEPIEWHIKLDADVEALEINSTTGIWPFTEPRPYKSTKAKPASATKRNPMYPLGTPAGYKIKGTCNGHSFELDPDMIVD